MRAAKITLYVVVILLVCASTRNISSQTASSQSPAPKQRIVIAASAVLDGRGHLLRDTRLVIAGSKIIAIDPKAAPVSYDLRGLTVMPGWIDSHVHITWSFGKDGRNSGVGETTQDAAY